MVQLLARAADENIFIRMDDMLAPRALSKRDPPGLGDGRRASSAAVDGTGTALVKARRMLDGLAGRTASGDLILSHIGMAIGTAHHRDRRGFDRRSRLRRSEGSVRRRAAGALHVEARRMVSALAGVAGVGTLADIDRLVA
jgi:hypothetical protein